MGMLVIEGRIYTVAEAAGAAGISGQAMRQRIARGVTGPALLAKRARPAGLTVITHGGRATTAKALAQQYRCSINAVHAVLRKGKRRRNRVQLDSACMRALRAARAAGGSNGK